MSIQRQSYKPLFFIAVIFTALTAHANTGFPMIFNTVPLMLFSLIPLIILEAFIASKLLGTSYEKSLDVMGTANLITTFIGLPLSNLLGFFMGGFAWELFSESVSKTFLKATAGFFWYDPKQWSRDETGHLIMPLPNKPEWYTLTIIGSAFLAHYLVSWFFEFLYMKKKFNHSTKDVPKAAVITNACSYAVIVVVLISYYIIAV